MGSLQKRVGTEGELYKLSGRKEGSVAEPRWLGEPGRPWVSLMMSSPSQTETHWMIMLQDGQKAFRLAFSIFTPPPQPHTPPNHPSPRCLTLYPPFSLFFFFFFYLSPQHVRPHLLLPLHTFIFGLLEFLTTPPIWSSGTLERLWSHLMMLPSHGGI